MSLETEIDNSEKLTQWLDEKIDGLEISSDDRYLIAAGCLDMALEHQKSIILLSANHLYGSAAALVRLIFESHVRGVWILYCASDKQIEQFKNDKLDKNFHQLIEEIEKIDAFNVGTLSHVKEKSWAIMNSFTHSGFWQVVRRNKPGEIAPNYTDNEIIDALRTANSFAILAAFTIANMSKDEGLVKEIYERGMEYFDIKP